MDRKPGVLDDRHGAASRHCSCQDGSWTAHRHVVPLELSFMDPDFHEALNGDR